MTYVWAAAVGAAVLLVGLGFAAFWPTFPPIDDTPIPSWMTEEAKRPRRYRAARRRDRKTEPRAAEVDEFLEVIRDTPDRPPADLAPAEPTGQTWMWSPEGPEARHRWEHLGEGTQPLHWPPKADGPHPRDWPPLPNR